jgi:putative sugar O-methyltransferase
MKPLLLIALFVACAAGCQKKNGEKNAPRSIYDQPIFNSSCYLSALDEEVFKNFKRHPYLNLLFENRSFEEGEKSLYSILENAPALVEKFELFRSNDRLGNPRVYDYGSFGFFSPETLRYAEFVTHVQKKFHDISMLHVIQIGAGYGGLCKILHDVAHFKSYTIVDLPEHLALAKKYLKEQGIETVYFLTPEELPKDSHFDFVLSDFSFSEFDKAHQTLFLDRLIQPSHYGYLLCHAFPKHFGVVPFQPDELKTQLKKRGHEAEIEIKEPLGERATYIINWLKEE